MNISVLFVDDDVNLLEGLNRLIKLERDDIDFDMALSGEEALKFLGKNRYDVIVSDHLMGGMGGLTLLSLVRTEYPEMKRIMLSAQVREDIHETAEAVAHKYISKPCDFKVLINEIEKLVDS